VRPDRSPSSARKCLIVVPDLGRGGAERQAVLVGHALREQGLEVRLFAQSGSDALIRDGLTGTLLVDGPWPNDPFVAQLVRLRSSVEAFAPDVVITFLRGAAARFAVIRVANAAARRAAWIVTARGNVRLLHLARTPATFGAQLLWLRLADRICPNSAALGGNIIAMDDALAGKVVVVPNIVQPFDLDPAGARARVSELVGGPGNRPVIGCIGSFQDERNYVLLANSLPSVLAYHPNAHVLVVGRAAGARVSSTTADFLARVAALNIQAHVTIAGEISDARRLLAGFDVFVLPSKLEGSSNALAEAMVAGAATATVPVADAEDILGGAGVVSRGWTPTSFGEAILAALEHAPSLRERATARGQSLVAERSSEKIGVQWASVAEEAIAVANSRSVRGMFRHPSVS
jgi:glycosyltransferase involved in cell wall biosynthesis